MKTPGAKQRWLVLGPVLAATLGAALWVGDENDESRDVPPRAERRQGLAGAPPAGVSPPLLAADPAAVAGEADEPGVDPFRSKSWYVAPPAAAPVKPAPPPLPFRYLGQLAEDGEIRVFLDHQGRNLIVKAGDVVAGTYAVEEIGAGRVVFTYLPLKEKQSLATGPA